VDFVGGHGEPSVLAAILNPELIRVQCDGSQNGRAGKDEGGYDDQKCEAGSALTKE
jgi:hypothetical protein